LQDDSLFRRHGLKLVTTSLVYEQMVRERPRSVSLTFEEADGMAACPQLVEDAYNNLTEGGGDAAQVPGMQVAHLPFPNVPAKSGVGLAFPLPIPGRLSRLSKNKTASPQLVKDAYNSLVPAEGRG